MLDQVESVMLKTTLTRNWLIWNSRSGKRLSLKREWNMTTCRKSPKQKSQRLIAQEVDKFGWPEMKTRDVDARHSHGLSMRDDGKEREETDTWLENSYY